MPMTSRIIQLTVLDVLATGMTLRRGVDFQPHLRKIKESLNASPYPVGDEFNYHLRCLTRPHREQAHSHSGTPLVATFVTTTTPCGNEPARAGSRYKDRKSSRLNIIH